MTNTNEEPCRACGSVVRLRTQELPRRLGEARARTEEIRVCTNRECDTNHPNRRSLGQVV